MIGILGYGVEGKSTEKFLKGKNYKIFDKSNGENYLKGLDECETIIRSAGVYPLQKEILNAQMKGAVLTSQVEMFFEMMDRNKIIGVTGTLGKGTVVSMISHCLDAFKIPHKIGGNFGVPVLDLVEYKDEIIILELSSFQLMTLGISPHIGVVLQVTSEHLDWHASVEQYIDAKANLVRWQKRDDCCIYNANSKGAAQIAKQSSGIKKPYYSLPNKIEEFKVKGTHNLQNMAATVQALECLGTVEARHALPSREDFVTALKNYKGLPLRLEYIGTKKEIDFYNDSYSTRPEATIAAAKAMTSPFTLILGGSEKNADFTELANALKEMPLLRGVAFIGETAERMQQQIDGKIFANLEEAFDWCVNSTPKCGAVLLSPACASFGLFANYKERGEKFTQLFSQI